MMPAGQTCTVEYFREGVDGIIGLDMMVDGGFAMGSNLPLFAYGEVDGGGETNRDHGNGRDSRNPGKGRFRHAQFRRALLDGRQGHRLAQALRPRYTPARPRNRTNAHAIRDAEPCRRDHQVAETACAADGLGNRAPTVWKNSTP